MEKYQKLFENKEILDIDLPNFTPTKYLSFIWKSIHCTSYFFFAIFYLISEIINFKKKNNLNNHKAYNIIHLLGSFSYFFSSFFEWCNFRRGCIGYSNLNSKLKKNIDHSLKAKILRSETGIKYFLNVISSLIFLFSNILSLNKIDKFPNFTNVNIYLFGFFILIIAENYKIEKILIKTKQYNVKNDLSNFFIEFFNLIFGILFSFGFILYILFYLSDNEKILNNIKTCQIFWIIGSISLLLSSICLIYRYFLSGYDDLNISNMTYVTI
jgi:hypothetical protein